MLVLLPPSEGKAPATSGEPVDLAALALPGLNGARQAVLGELVDLCSADGEKAREILGLSERLRGEVARNAALRTAPARPAGEVYTGVLYDALGLVSLSPAARQRAETSVLIFSCLWGAVRVIDRIPAYRCAAGVRLPGLGGLGAFWRGPMTEAMPADPGIVLDLRSTAYAAMWQPRGEQATRTVTVRVLQSRIVGGVEKRSVVSHFNKATKGRLARDLLEAGAEPARPADVADALRALGYRVEAVTPQRLDIIVTDPHRPT